MSEKRENAINAIKRRSGASKSRTPNINKIQATRSSGSEAGSSGLNFYSGEVSSLKVQPKTVLIISLVYLGIVVMLHIMSKLRGGNAPIPE